MKILPVASIRVVAAIALSPLAVPSAAVSQPAATSSTAPLTLEKLKNALQSGSAPSRLLNGARESCISFRITPAVEAELRAASADALFIEGLRAVCYRAPSADRPPATTATARPPARPPAAQAGRPPAAARPAGRSLARGRAGNGTLGNSSRRLPNGARFEDWTFTATAGERLQLDAASDEFDTVLEVGVFERGDFLLADSDDDGGSGTNSRLVFRPETSGQYVLRVRAYGASGVGRYTVEFRQAPPMRPPQSRQASRNSPNIGTLDNSSATDERGRPIDHWTFFAQEREELTIDLRATDFDTYLLVGQMRGGEFVSLASDDDSGDGTNSLLQDWVAPVTGEYVVRVRPFGERGRGTYTLLIRAPRTSAEDNVRTSSLSSASSVEEGKYYEDWRMDATAGERSILTLSSDEFDTVLRVGRMVDGVFVELASNDDASGQGTNSRLEWTAPSTGEYIVRVTSYDAGSTGRYTIRMSR